MSGAFGNLVRTHGRITFIGLEVPMRLLITEKVIYSDLCEHKYVNNSKMNTYRYCKDCGAKRFNLMKIKHDLYITLEKQLIFAQVIDPISGNEHHKAYIVMEWYDGCYKIIPSNFTKMPERHDEFKNLMESLGIWKQKRFGIFTLENPSPTEAFYKNESIRKVQYGKPAAYIDTEINDEKKTKDEELIDNIKAKAKKEEEEIEALDKTLPADDPSTKKQPVKKQPVKNK